MASHWPNCCRIGTADPRGNNAMAKIDDWTTASSRGLAIFAVFAIFAPAVFLPRTAVPRPTQSEPLPRSPRDGGEIVPASRRADGVSLGEIWVGGGVRGDQRDRAMQRRLQNSAYAGS